MPKEAPMARRILLAFALTWPAPALAAHDPHAAPCATIRACRTELAHARQAIRWQIATRHRIEARLRYRWRPTVHYAIRLASRAFGVPEASMRRVAACESGFDPTATNGRYAGVFQLGAPFMAATRFAGFDRYDPLANALAAASVVRVQGWRQWECQP